MYPATYAEKKNSSYVWFANAVASEAPSTQDHTKRMVVARQMASFNTPFDFYVDVDFKSQGYDDTTPLATMQTRLSGVVTNLIALGFGG